jgi:HEAT repeat protein
MGNKAIPTLLHYAATRDTRMRMYILDHESKFPWFPTHLHLAEEDHIRALNGFYALGTNASPAVSKLARLLDDDDVEVRWCACSCLSSIGSAAQDAVPALISEFKRAMSGTNRESFIAGYAMIKIGPAAGAAIPTFRTALTNASPECRACAQAALLNFNIPAPPEFYFQLTNPACKYPNATLLATWCGTNAAAAVPILVSGLNSADSSIQSHSLEGLGDLHQRPELCIPAIIPFLESSNIMLRYKSAMALEMFGESAKQAGPALARHLTDPNDGIREVARFALPLVDPERASKLGLHRVIDADD